MGSPSDLSPGKTTINFDGYANNTVANDLFLGQGVRFTRDDNAPIPIIDWEALGRSTSSPPNVIATISGIASTYVDHLNLVFTQPTFEVGAFFGNDQAPSFASITLSVFDSSDTLIGSLTVPTNGNTQVDQFVGLRSDIPFTTARFQNNEPDVFYSVVLDDVTFSTVPEPSSLSIMAIGSALVAGLVAAGGRGKVRVPLVCRYGRLAAFDEPAECSSPR